MTTDSSARTVAGEIAQASSKLKFLIASPRLEAELLLCHVLGWQRTQLYTRSEHILAAAQSIQFAALIKQRVEGMPIAYLLRRQEFWSLPLEVNESVLIPRADTELLVHTGLKLLSGKKAVSVLELGTGSGAIALALASERSDWHITACDVSSAALRVAKRNAQRLNIKSVTFLQSNWFANLPRTKFDLIISNPPYIADNDPHLQHIGVRFEPSMALVSGADGLDSIRHITCYATHFLTTSGHLLLEHGYDQGDKVRSILKSADYTDVVTLRDAGGNERVSLGLHRHTTA